MRLIIVFFIALFLTSCNQNSQNGEIVQKKSKKIEWVKLNQSTLSKFKYEDVARYAIASLMGESTKNIKVSKNKELYSLFYIRNSDKKKYEYKIKFDGGRIIWANIDGRWRNSKDDEKIYFEENAEKLKIITIYSDNSQDVQEYKIGD